jgi:hypothetical protein
VSYIGTGVGGLVHISTSADDVLCWVPLDRVKWGKLHGGPWTAEAMYAFSDRFHSQYWRHFVGQLRAARSVVDGHLTTP